MDVRMRIAVASAGVNVAAFCRDHGISRQTFYVWKRRYEREGQSGLDPRSRVPRRNPNWVGAELEDAIVILRKELEALSVDAGPATIRWHLGRRRPRGRVPSEATIWRVLVRHGHIVPAPQKRSRASYRRFEASVPNELWQADCMDWAAVKILSFLDDHSRVALLAPPVLLPPSTWRGSSGHCDTRQSRRSTRGSREPRCGSRSRI